MLLSDYKEDLSKQESGSYCYLGDGHFLVKRFGTSQSTKELEEIKRELYGFSVKETDTNKVIATWLCEYGVTGWEGVLDEDENELKYSKQNARRIFLNPSYFNGLNSLLINHANMYTNYLYDEMTEDVDNVKKK